MGHHKIQDKARNDEIWKRKGCTKKKIFAGR